jgi:hypothetical protein
VALLAAHDLDRLENQSRATFSKVLLAALRRAARLCCRWTLGSLPVSTDSLAPCRRFRAMASVTVGYTPKEISFSTPST